MTWLVVGLARSGLAAKALLEREGHEVIGYDARDGGDGIDLLDRADAVVKSPGVPPHAPVVAEARRRGMEVIGELELAWRRLRGTNPFVAITGTNGKTTVTQWLAHVLAIAGVDHVTAGNVGTPLSARVGEVAPGAWVVCECSSYQLHDAPTFAPEVAVLLNLGSDHLDWHGDLASYHAAKRSVLARAGTAIEAPAPVDVGLPGEHNRRNGGAVAAAARAIGVPEDAIAEGLRTFAGVEHRLERVPTDDGLRWINDSKATNVESALTAVAALAGERLHWVLGGDDRKQEDFAPLRAPAEAAAGVYLIGEAAGRLAAALGRGEPCGDLAGAVARARAAARPGDVVLLSPACASFDQFPDFEARGRAFKALARSDVQDAEEHGG